MDSTEVHEEGSTPRSTPIHRSIKRSSLWALVAKAHATFRQTSCFQMRPGALRAAIEEDEREGIRPVAVCAVAGTTSTTSFDPLEEIAEICRDSGIWLHVDAAYAGPAAIAPELRPLFAGWEHADSIVVNPHKWLFTPIDCSLLYCRRPEALQEVFSMTPAYLRTREEMVARNLMDYGVALGRRFRSLKLWFVLRYFGSRGIADRIREHCRLARRFAGHVSGANEWRLVAPTPLSTVVFRFAPAGLEEDVADELNRKLLDAVNASGESFPLPYGSRGSRRDYRSGTSGRRRSTWIVLGRHWCGRRIS